MGLEGGDGGGGFSVTWTHAEKEMNGERRKSDRHKDCRTEGQLSIVKKGKNTKS